MAANYKLAFGVSTDDQGFRNSKTSINRFPDPSIITREIIQNALDANETGIVEVAFETGELPLKELPGLTEYKEAFDAAKQRKNSNNEEDSVAKIEESLQDSKAPVLWVSDNGKGLDSANMRRILADGGSEKKGMAGSYGVGHLSVFSSSDLNYVIYGGCSQGKENGYEQILSGQCILASHSQNGKMRSPNGYICVPSSNEDPRERQFPQLADLESGVWKDKLLQISKKGTGSFICITAFNGFNTDDDKTVEKEILYAAASHFMPAIFEGKMKVTVGNAVLDSQNSLYEELQSKKGEKNKRKETPFVASGRCFYNLFECLKNKEIEFEVPALPGEKVRVYMDLNPEGGRRKIHLYRHGMWITDNLFNSNEFTGYKPFTAIVLVDKEKASETGSIISDAEGERHMQIRLDALSPAKKKILSKILKNVKENIKDKAEKIGGNGEYIDYVKFGSGASEITRRPASPSRRRNSSKKKSRRKNKGSKSNADRKGADRYVRRAQSLPIWCTTPVIEGDSIRFIAIANKKHNDVEMRVFTPRGSDTSCASPFVDDLVYLLPVSEVNGTKVAEESHMPELVGEQTDYVAVKLKSLPQGENEIVLKMAATPPHRSLSYVAEFVSRGKQE